MITQPSSIRIIEVIRQELAATVLPSVTDPQVIASLHMVDHILGTLAVRAEHEIAWLVEETTDLATLGREAVGADPGVARVAAALAALDATPADSLHLTDVSARYSLATELLSCMIEELPSGSDLRTAAEAKLDARLEHEVAVIGEFELVGRS
jgi:hypothetical protein